MEANPLRLQPYQFRTYDGANRFSATRSQYLRPPALAAADPAPEIILGGCRQVS